MKPNGEVESAELVSDPGHGFGREALACARRNPFQAARWLGPGGGGARGPDSSAVYPTTGDVSSPTSAENRSDTATTVLVVDDDPDIRESLTELLEEAGYKVIQAGDGNEAEALLRRPPSPACILLDLWMPGMDGWTFASRLKAGQSSSIPVIVITAADPQWGYPAPSLYVLRKPLDTNRLLALVRALAPPRTS